MKVYGIANLTREVAGHGEFHSEARIIKQGAYGTGRFPPLFTNREDAQAWADTIHDHTVVVELELWDLRCPKMGRWGLPECPPARPGEQLATLTPP